jgi:hypothetical protein
MDWVSPWWQAELLPDRWDVCGFVLPSLSVWHTFALENVGNKYLTSGQADRNDAACLLLLCGRNRKHGRRLMLNPDLLNREMARVARRIRKMGWQSVNIACLDYVSSCLRTPGHWTKSDTTGKRVAAPYQFHIVRKLCMEYGYTAERAWDTEYARARCMYDASGEASGFDESLMSPEHERIDEEMYERSLAQ